MSDDNILSECTRMIEAFRRWRVTFVNLIAMQVGVMLGALYHSDLTGLFSLIPITIFAFTYRHATKGQADWIKLRDKILTEYY